MIYRFTGKVTEKLPHAGYLREHVQLWSKQIYISTVTIQICIENGIFSETKRKASIANERRIVTDISLLTYYARIYISNIENYELVSLLVILHFTDRKSS